MEGRAGGWLKGWMGREMDRWNGWMGGGVMVG